MTAPAAANRRQVVQPKDLSFHTLTLFFGGCKRIRTDRQPYVKKFIQANIDKTSHDAFQVFRLVLPQLDRKRGNYKLLEAKLADALIKAAGIDKKSQEATVIQKWKRPGSKTAGDFATVLKNSIFNVRCMIDPADPDPARLKTLKVGKLNEELDKLAAAAGNINEQANILRGLMQITTPDQMYWIVQIILKSLKINAGESTLFKSWHKDAEAYYNNSGMDLEHVFNEMIVEGETYSTSMRLGVAVRPQLALMTNSVTWAFSKMHGKKGNLRDFVVEIKFDGERIQVHRTENEISYYSRRAIEHGEKSNFDVLNGLIQQQTRGSCALDGEMVVWNKKKHSFEPFGSLKPLINAIKEKKRSNDVLEFNEIDMENAAVIDPDYEAPLVGDCELLYIAFDILHNGKIGVNEEPLKERHKLLEEVVVPAEIAVALEGSCVCGRMMVLLPGKTYLNSTLASRVSHTEKDISEMLEEMARIREEGIIVKALDSPWLPNERFSNNWIKIKPNYLKGIELDCVVIGAWGGKGGRGGQYTQYLLALAELPASRGERVSTWHSFCRVGSGLSDSEREEVHQQIESLCVEAGERPPPRCYRITGREKPDVWIMDPDKSVVFQIHADLRTIRSLKFATGYSLRFPSIQLVRNDKTGTMASTLQELQDLVDQQNHKAEMELKEPLGCDGGKKRRRNNKRERLAKHQRARLQLVPAARPTDLTQVEVESNTLEVCHIVFANYGEYDKKELEQIVKQLGGELHFMFTNSGITHILAGDELGSKVKGHIQQDRDVISIAWLLECKQQGQRVPLRPRYYIHRSHASLLADPSVDVLGDSYMSDVDECDVAALLGHAMCPVNLDPAKLAEGLVQSDENADDEQVAQAQRQLSRRLQTQDAAQALAFYLDDQLAAIGQPDPRYSCMRSCSALLLCLSGSRAGSGGRDQQHLFSSVQSIAQQGTASRARLQQLQTAGVEAEVRVMGGRLARTVGQNVTHVVGLLVPRGPATPGSTPAAAPAMDPETLLRVVSEQAGGPPAVATLKLVLATGDTHLVTDSWVHRCMEDAALLGAATPASEADFSLRVASLDSPDEWPWETFLPKKKPRQTSSSHSAQPTVGRPTLASRGQAAAPSIRPTSHRPRAEPRGGNSDAMQEAGAAAAVAAASSDTVAPMRAPACRGRASKIGRVAVPAVKKEKDEMELLSTGAAAASVPEPGTSVTAAAGSPPHLPLPALEAKPAVLPGACASLTGGSALDKVLCSSAPPGQLVDQLPLPAAGAPLAAQPAALAEALPRGPAVAAPGWMFNALFGDLAAQALPAPAPAACPHYWSPAQTPADQPSLSQAPATAQAPGAEAEEGPPKLSLRERARLLNLNKPRQH